MDLRLAAVCTTIIMILKGLRVSAISIPTWRAAAAVRCLIAIRPPERRSRGLPLRMMTTAAAAGLDASRPRPLLRECLSSAPDEPGCYIMESGDGRKLYIGKSVKLSSRVPSYFSSSNSSAAASSAGSSVLPAGNLSRRIAVMTTLVER